MNRLLPIILTCLGIGIGQSKEFEKEIMISEGNAEKPPYITIPLVEIGSAVVFHWPNYPAICPVTAYGDFLLEKINPEAQKYLIEDHRCQGVAGKKDSTTYNFEFVYEVINFHGSKYYLKVLSGDTFKLKIRVSDNLTSLSAAPLIKRTSTTNSSETFFINGRAAQKNHREAINKFVKKSLSN